jgi:uncharacterized membrane protein YccC
MNVKRYAVLAAVGLTSLGALAAAGAASLLPSQFRKRSRRRKMVKVFTSLGR